MAENKNSFVLYSDHFGMIKHLPDDVAGRLFKHIYSYVNDENPISEEVLLNVAFEPIKQSLKRDLKKWESQLNQRREAGKRSAELRALTKSNDRSISLNETTRNPTVSVSVSDSVNDINNINVELPLDQKPIIDFDKLLKFINEATGRNFQVINKTVKGKYLARLKDGYTKEQITNAVVNACKDKNHIENGFKYLTPEFFSRADKIDLHGSEQKTKPITFIK